MTHPLVKAARLNVMGSFADPGVVQESKRKIWPAYKKLQSEGEAVNAEIVRIESEFSALDRLQERLNSLADAAVKIIADEASRIGAEPEEFYDADLPHPDNW